MKDMKTGLFLAIFVVMLLVSAAVYFFAMQVTNYQNSKVIASFDQKFQDLQSKLNPPPVPVPERIMVVNNTVNVPVAAAAPKIEVTCPAVPKRRCTNQYGSLGNVSTKSIMVTCSDGSEKNVLCSDVIK